MYCVKCGEKLPDDAKFCVKCGSRVDIPEQAAQPEAAPVYQAVQPTCAAEPYPKQAATYQHPAVQAQPAEPAYQPYAMDRTDYPSSEKPGTRLVRTTVRPLGGIILMFFALFNLMALIACRYLFAYRNGTIIMKFSYRYLVSYEAMFIASVLILLGMFLHHKKGNILVGIGCGLLLIQCIVSTISWMGSYGTELRYMFDMFIDNFMEFIRFFISAGASGLISFMMILPLLFITIYHLIGGRTFRNPVKLLCGIAIIIVGHTYLYSYIVLYPSKSWAFIMGLATAFYWIFLGISLIIYTPFRKIRK